MCTIIFGYKVFEEAEIVIAENRDEFYGRDFSKPKKIFPDDKNNFWYMSPEDDLKGGTWIGYNSNGIAATLSNLKYEYGGDEDLRSRGLLCKEILQQQSVEKARQKIEESTNKNNYNGFNLLVASNEKAIVAVYEEDPKFMELNKGFHVITNSRIDNPDERAINVKEELPSKELSLNDWTKKIKDILSSHEMGVCRHGEKIGTTSSSIITLNTNKPSKSKYLFSTGPLCKMNYENI